jgi:hypothetical protein
VTVRVVIRRAHSFVQLVHVVSGVWNPLFTRVDVSSIGSSPLQFNSVGLLAFNNSHGLSLAIPRDGRPGLPRDPDITSGRIIGSIDLASFIYAPIISRILRRQLRHASLWLRYLVSLMLKQFDKLVVLEPALFGALPRNVQQS